MKGFSTFFCDCSARFSGSRCQFGWEFVDQYLWVFCKPNLITTVFVQNLIILYWWNVLQQTGYNPNVDFYKLLVKHLLFCPSFYDAYAHCFTHCTASYRNLINRVRLYDLQYPCNICAITRNRCLSHVTTSCTWKTTIIHYWMNITEENGARINAPLVACMKRAVCEYWGVKWIW